MCVCVCKSHPSRLSCLVRSGWSLERAETGMAIRVKGVVASYDGEIYKLSIPPSRKRLLNSQLLLNTNGVGSLDREIHSLPPLESSDDAQDEADPLMSMLAPLPPLRRPRRAPPRTPPSAIPIVASPRRSPPRGRRSEGTREALIAEGSSWERITICGSTEV